MTEDNDEILTPQQERFCINFTQNDSHRGNATLSYADAFDFDLDSQATDDAQYVNANGETYAEWELKDEPLDSNKNLLKCKKVQDSSYKRMYDNVSTYASKLKKRMYIQNRCRQLLNEFMTDIVIDTRLMNIILHGNDGDSMRAIAEYNKLKQRIVDRKDITTGGKPITISFDPAFNKQSGTTPETEGNSSESTPI